MSITTRLSLSFFSILVAAGVAYGADGAPAGRPRVGEVRSFVVGSDNADAVAQLHRDGWLEARGQLLSTIEFPELFQMVGRTWTTNDVAEDRFAIPEVRDRSQRDVSLDSPFGVLGPGDLVTSGRGLKGWLRQSPISFWIFVGRDVSQLEPRLAK